MNTENNHWPPKPKAPQVIYKWPYLFAPFPNYAIITEWMPFAHNDGTFIKWMAVYQFNEDHPMRKKELQKGEEQLQRLQLFLREVVKIDHKKLHEPFTV